MSLANFGSVGEKFIQIMGLALFLAILPAQAQQRTSADTPNASEYLSGAVIVVPPGNRFLISPPYSASVQKKFDKPGATTPEQKFQNAISILKKNKFPAALDRIAPLYGVTPLQVLASVVGEHTFNTDIYDYAQGIYMNMIKGWIGNFDSGNVKLGALLREPPFQVCDQQYKTSYGRWNCYVVVWDKSYRGRNGYSASNLNNTFFNPYFAGHTFGIGQLDPMRALMVADHVARVRGRPMITVDNPEGVYTAILDDESNIHYASANIAAIIDTYKRVAHFDISKNIGTIATLYNLGAEGRRAHELYTKNMQRANAGQPLEWPVENFYGWKMNEKEPVLRKVLLDAGVRNID